MDKKKLQDIINNLDESVDTERAYFSFEEWTPHEFCIKANKDGLITFAVELLELSKSDIEGTRLSLSASKLNWFNDYLDVQFVELTLKTRLELSKPKKNSSSNSWLINVALWTGLLIMIYLVITGIIFTIKLI